LRSLEVYENVPRLSPEFAQRQEQLEYLMRRYGDKVLYLAYSYLRDKEWAEDVAQEVFLQVFISLPDFQRNSSFYTWIYRITINLCRDQLRKQIRRRRLEQKENWGPSAEQDPEEKALENIERRELWTCILQLPLNLREILVLYYFHQLSIKEITQTLGISQTAARVRLYRARKQLQKSWLKGIDRRG
jgi:RNA polymerase sigma-70 factor (ECF subfamily)